MELSALSGMEVMEALARMEIDPDPSKRTELSAQRLVNPLATMVVNVLNEQKHPLRDMVQNNFPLELRFTWQCLIDEAAKIEQELLGGLWKKRAVVLKFAQLFFLRFEHRHGLKDALGELFLLYMRSQLALKNRSSIGLFLASQMYATMTEALYHGSPELAGESAILYKTSVPYIPSANLSRDQKQKNSAKYIELVNGHIKSDITEHAKEEGKRWAGVLLEALADFCPSNNTARVTNSSFDSRSYSRQQVKAEIVRILMLCLCSFQERRGREGPDFYNQGSEIFLTAALHTFARIANSPLDKSIIRYVIDRELFDSDVAELFEYFDEDQDLSEPNPAYYWSLQVDEGGAFLPVRFAKRVAEASPNDPGGDYTKQTVQKYQLESLTNRGAPIAIYKYLKDAYDSPREIINFSTDTQKPSVTFEEYFIPYEEEATDEMSPATFVIQKSAFPAESDVRPAEPPALRPRQIKVPSTRQTAIAIRNRSTASPQPSAKRLLQTKAPITRNTAIAIRQRSTVTPEPSAKKPRQAETLKKGKKAIAIRYRSAATPKPAAKRPRQTAASKTKKTAIAIRDRSTVTPEASGRQSSTAPPLSYSSSRSSPAAATPFATIKEEDEDEHLCIHQRKLMQVYRKTSSLKGRQLSGLEETVKKNWARYSQPLAPGNCPICGH